MVAIEGRGRFCKWPPSVNDMFPNVSLIAAWTSELASCFCSRVHGASWALTRDLQDWKQAVLSHPLGERETLAEQLLFWCILVIT